MLYLEKFTFDSWKLCIFCLGGQSQGCNIETHDVIFIVTKSDDEAVQKIKSKWYGTEKSLHVDSWFAVENIDGFNIRVVKDPPESSKNHLYFVNLGFYKSGVFGESHFMTLVVAESKGKAIEKAKNQAPSDKEMVHSDNIYDVDDCIRIYEIDNFYIALEYSGIYDAIEPKNGYQKLRTTLRQS